jgi:hypothetical protein
MAKRGPPIYLDNDDIPEYYAERKNASTGAWEPAAGLSSQVVKLCATEGGSAIHATLTKTTTERASAPGYYYAQYEGDDLRTQLGSATYIGKDVFEAFGDGTNLLVWAARKVFATRPV